MRFSPDKTPAKTLAIVVGLLIAGSPVGACTAETAPMSQARPPTPMTEAPVDAVFGLWSVRAVDGGARCQIALSNFRQGELHGVKVERCAISALAGATGWRPVAGGFEIVGTEGGRPMRFIMTGADGFRSGDGALVGERAAMR